MNRVLRHIALLGLLCSPGCQLLPEIAHQPTVHNPFPQLSKVAIAPFFNQSDEKTIDGVRMALAYYNELQLVPGFEVVPVDVVQRAIVDHQLTLASGNDARRLAQILGVDAVVIGTVTDFTPYYPPRLALTVKWYAANPNFHPIPAGYGLPWGTPEEQDIPAPLVFESEMALAKAQLATQTPPYEKMPPGGEVRPLSYQAPADKAPSAKTPGQKAPGQKTSLQQPLPPGALPGPLSGGPPVGPPVAGPGAGLPPNWPDPRGFIPPPPRMQPPPPCPTDLPVLQHTRNYNGHDMEFTEALSSYYFSRDDARFGGWQTYLERSDDFIRFCCHMHIFEMLAARGGAGETRVVWRWPNIR
jgi:hypothetical protein